MRSTRFLCSLAAGLTVASASNAQTTSTAQVRDVAPWWLGQPVSASMGNAERKVSVNRADLTVTFQGTGKTAAEASRLARGQASLLAQALATLGRDKVRLESSLSITPIYQRYKDKDGRLVDNERADKIESYAARAELSLEVFDLTIYRQVIAAANAAQPFNLGGTDFRVEPDNTMQAALLREALSDAATRARDAAEAAGGHLGPVKLIDMLLVTGTDPRNVRQNPANGADDSLQEIIVTGSRVASRPAPPPPSAPSVGGIMQAMSASNSSEISAYNLPFTPPSQVMRARACIIYGLN
jgi:uncharacterized protein YggE